MAHMESPGRSWRAGRRLRADRAAAALFHADAPNDVGPSAYNEDEPTGELPASPLAPRPDAVGFRWTT
jgi:hypothetical protein